MTTFESVQAPGADFTPLAAPARPQLPPKAKGDAAFLELVQASAARIGETAEAFLGSDHPHATHQMRVALRRHRSLLKLFAPYLDPGFAEAQSSAAQAIARRLGPLREADVMASETLPALAREIAASRGGARKARALEALAEKLAEQADRDRAELRAGDAPLRCFRLLLGLERALAEGRWRPTPGMAVCKARGPIGAKGLDGKAARIAAQALERALRRVRRWGDRMETLSIDERHEMRKKAKVLRYAVEFFGGLFDAATVKPYRRALKKMQSSFGALNDAADAAKLRDLPLSPSLLPAIEAAIAKSEERMEAEFAAAIACWRALEKTPVFWR